jgi:hypothetical protein
MSAQHRFKDLGDGRFAIWSRFTCDICHVTGDRTPKQGLIGWTPFYVDPTKPFRHACPKEACKVAAARMVAIASVAKSSTAR